MFRIATAAIAALALTACARPLPKCPGPNAESMAHTLEGRASFRAMLTDLVTSTVVGKIASRQDPVGVERRLPQAVDHAMDLHGNQWDANLARVYSSTLSPKELMTLCIAMDENDNRRFREFADRVDARIKAQSMPLVHRAGADALKEIFEGSPKS